MRNLILTSSSEKRGQLLELRSEVMSYADNPVLIADLDDFEDRHPHPSLGYLRESAVVLLFGDETSLDEIWDYYQYLDRLSVRDLCLIVETEEPIAKTWAFRRRRDTFSLLHIGRLDDLDVKRLVRLIERTFTEHRLTYNNPIELTYDSLIEILDWELPRGHPRWKHGPPMSAPPMSDEPMSGPDVDVSEKTRGTTLGPRVIGRNFFPLLIILCLIGTIVAALWYL